MDPSPRFSDLLRHARRAAGLTQEALAERAGISVRAVIDLERGVNRTPRRDTLELLVEALDLPSAERMEWERLRRRLRLPTPPAPGPGRAGADDGTISAPVPAEVGTLFGREHDRAVLADLVRTTRLVTLTGPGGVGKTRLAIAVAHTITSTFPDGVVFVSLEAIRDPALVLSTIATRLGIRDAGGAPILETIANVIGQREVVLILDNLEQVVSAAPDIAALLVRCPGVQMLGTSRAPLRLAVEQEYPLQPLPVAHLAHIDDIGDLSASAAVALFLARARAVKPDLTVSPLMIRTVADICRHLDGIPLAIELAAARTRVLSPQALRERLTASLQVLSDGGRDRPDRQRTLRDTVRWSYDLLSSDEQWLFRWLSVFVGGWTLERAEAVRSRLHGPNIDLIDGLSSLVERSLVVYHERPDGDTHFAMLTVIREFGYEALHACQDATETLRALTASFVDLLVEADLNREGGTEFVESLDRLEREMDNLRLVLAWAIEHDDVAIFQLLHGAWHLWYTRGHLSEGRQWLQQALERWPTATPAARLQAMYQAGTLATWQGDTDYAIRLHQEQLQLAAELGDAPAIGFALVGLGRATTYSGDADRGREYYEQSVALARTSHDRELLALAAGNLAGAYVVLGDFDRALALNAEALAIERDDGSLLGTQIRLTDRGQVLFERGDVAEARQVWVEALVLARQIGMKRYIADLTTALARVAGAEGDIERELRLLGAAQRLRQVINYHRLAVFFPDIDARLSAHRIELGDRRVDDLLADGAALTVEDVIALASGKVTDRE